MTTGYEVKAYADLSRIADAAERIAKALTQPDAQPGRPEAQSVNESVPSGIVRRAAVAYLHGQDANVDLGELADALGVPREDVEALQ